MSITLVGSRLLPHTTNYPDKGQIDINGITQAALS